MHWANFGLHRRRLATKRPAPMLKRYDGWSFLFNVLMVAENYNVA